MDRGDSTGRGDTMIRVLLAEDQGTVRGALAALLRLEPDLEVVAEVERGDAVVPAAIASQPDVALLDIEMPGGMAWKRRKPYMSSSRPAVS